MASRLGPAVAAVVLAAGQGTRFAAQAGGAFKLLADFRGAPVVRHVVKAARASCAHPVIVVTGHESASVTQALAALDTLFVHNPDYRTGLSSSLRAGVTTLPPECAGAVILLGDMPCIRPTLIDGLIAAFADRPQADAVIPVNNGKRGNPVLISRALFARVAELTGDEGARPLLREDADVLELPVSDDGVTIDIDVPDTLTALASRP